MATNPDEKDYRMKGVTQPNGHAGNSERAVAAADGTIGNVADVLPSSVLKQLAEWRVATAGRFSQAPKSTRRPQKR
jgi:hypothetical protein